MRVNYTYISYTHYEFFEFIKNIIELLRLTALYTKPGELNVGDILHCNTHLRMKPNY